MTSSAPRRVFPPDRSGFSLIELLVGCAVLALMLVMLFSVISHTSETWRRSRGDIEAFQTARNAYETLTRNLSQASLNTYWQYDNPTNPTRYLRASDLQFVVRPSGSNGPGTAGTGGAVFFQAPVGAASNASLQGLNALFNGLGYYVQFSGDQAYRPSSITGPEKYRYRLMQMRIPADNLSIYTATNALDFSWFTSQTNTAFPIADNVILLVIWPRLTDQEDAGGAALAPDFSYNSRLDATNLVQPRTASQLPPVLEVAMVAVDETSILRMDESTNEPASIQQALQNKFQTAGRSVFENDLKELEAALAGAKINYRVFRSTIPLRESRWSE